MHLNPLFFSDANSTLNSQAMIPGGHPIGNHCFLYSDLRTFCRIHLNQCHTIYSYQIPRTPWNKKESKVGEVLKRKLFRNTVQQSNRPTRKNILKCNFL